MRKNCDGDTRIAYIEQIETGEKSVSEAAKELGVSENMLHKWRRQLANNTGQGFPRRSEKAFRYSKHERY